MDRNGFRVLGHPVHTLFTHFPIALWSVSILWDILGIWRGNPLWWHFSFWSIALGLVFALFAAGTGLVDSVTVKGKGPEEKTLTLHMYVILSAFALYLASFLVRMKTQVPSGGNLILAVSLSVFGFIVLVIGSWYGGELVYQFGIGTKHR